MRSPELPALSFARAAITLELEPRVTLPLHRANQRASRLQEVVQPIEGE
jgi:hypothetical protein